jgi:hypothetical protein
MPRLELIFPYSASGGGCFRWRGEDSTCLQSEHDPRPEGRRSEGYTPPPERPCPLLQEKFANSRNGLCASIRGFALRKLANWLILFAYRSSLGSAIDFNDLS